MTRVIAGKYKGRKLKTVRGTKTRLTAGRVREALFNIVGDRVTGCTFADLYAGAGIVGMEALSRGAACGVFVERARGPAGVIRANLGTLGADAKSEVYITTVNRWIRETHEAFDIMFLDPPYALDDVAETMKAIDMAHLLDPAGLLILEHAARLTPPQPGGNLELRRTQTYGDSALSFYERTDETAGAN